MKTRVISSLAGIALLLVILTAFHKVTFNIIAVIVYLISLWEIRGTFKENCWSVTERIIQTLQRTDGH